MSSFRIMWEIIPHKGFGRRNLSFLSWPPHMEDADKHCGQQRHYSPPSLWLTCVEISAMCSSCRLRQLKTDLTHTHTHTFICQAEICVEIMCGKKCLHKHVAPSCHKSGDLCVVVFLSLFCVMTGFKNNTNTHTHTHTHTHTQLMWLTF